MRRNKVVSEIRRIERSYDKLHNELLKCDMEIGALEHVQQLNV